MEKKQAISIETGRTIGVRDSKIYGHFLEHFHRQIYGGIYEPGSPLADEDGMRTDVLEALKPLAPSIVRWPGGCYVSAHHWKDGIGAVREPAFDNAWRVEESNRFGTDEFILFCRKLGMEPYICTNAGTGTQEEMSDWVEYCNLRTEGKWARRRMENGFPEPHAVTYWSIGNENYYRTEIGSKTAEEWCRYVREAAKMMKRVDPTIELLAASTSDLDWNIRLLREAGDKLDWISIHDYWDPLWEDNRLAGYEACMAKTLRAGEKIARTRHVLGALGYLGKIRIAFDEWNLRGWHHPHVDSVSEDYLTPRDLNDDNSCYTMADAVFSACFLNECLRNCDVVGMANFAPTVNTRGMIYTHAEGIVLRPTYFVFQLFVQQMGETVVDLWMPNPETFEVEENGTRVAVPALDVVATLGADERSLRISIVNRHPGKPMIVRLDTRGWACSGDIRLYSVLGASKDAFNDVANPHDVRIHETRLAPAADGLPVIEVMPHSVNVAVLTV